jgi:hypothetical protein
MNKSAALKAVVGMQYSDALAEKAFLDRATSGDSVYNPADAKEIDLVAIEVLQTLLITPSISEGDYSVKYDYKAIQARLSTLIGKYPVEFPVINAKSKGKVCMVGLIQYPHLASIFENVEATRDENGNWVDPVPEDAKTFICRAEPAIGNRNNGLKEGGDGAVTDFNWIVYCPLETPDIVPGTQIIVYGAMQIQDSVKRFSRGQLNVRIWL